MKGPRLNSHQLKQLPPEIARPNYARDQHAGVIHLGIGAFHRAHQAVYFDDLLNSGEANWMIRGASLRSDSAARALNPQDGLFTVRAADDTQSNLRVIGSVAEVINAKTNQHQLLAHLGAEQTKLVTLTVTEKGYHLDIAAKTLIATSPEIKHDIANICAPISAPGYLVAGLAARKAAGLQPFTVLSCDNLPHNGDLTRLAVLALAERISPALARWIDTEGAFPSSMVDRIVPATSPADVEALTQITGWQDKAMVKTEPFSQWVIEDQFCNDRPKLDTVGVQFTADVSPWETTKLRMLNGAHSTVAYVASLAGHQFVSDAVQLPEFERLINQLWDEIEVTLPSIPRFSVTSYRRELFERFSNSTLQHRTHQIAMDGSQKIPQRILAPLYERKARGLGSPALITALASWIKYQRGIDALGNEFTVLDPLHSNIEAVLKSAGKDTYAIAKGVTAIEAIFGSKFTIDSELVNTLARTLKRINA